MIRILLFRLMSRPPVELFNPETWSPKLVRPCAQEQLYRITGVSRSQLEARRRGAAGGGLGLGPLLK